MFLKDLETPIVKICGLQTAEAAQIAIDEGASLLGVICVPNRKRTVRPDIAKDISTRVRAARARRSGSKVSGPYLVGVFRNQSVEEIEQIRQEYGLDVVQLHGSENWTEYQHGLQNIPIIKRFIFPNDCEDVICVCEDQHSRCLALFDSEAGGTGEVLDWNSISQWSKKSGAQFILAGGLNPVNVGSALQLHGVLGVDVSGGVESSGEKDGDKIKQFIANAVSNTSAKAI
ncbi:LAFE_0C09164g1_1 [Lachancea fermentati]|uniref:N-(5'-phosphoribosyl)anthranilate isomerase n=1 Tax=Lachancea fermentati TaxID=4955 RepID=A0A1G4M9W9_LACFM|nr:LAFE_0C09164g1_1 [Lachancea fermentati]